MTSSRNGFLRKACLYLTLALLAAVSVSAQTSTVTSTNNAVAWLNGQQRGNGTWGVIPELVPRDTAHVVMAQTLVRASNVNVTTALAWLGSQGALDANEFLAEEAMALSLAKVDPAGFLARLNLQRSTSAADYGGFAEYNGNSYDSALAVQALASQEALYSSAISGAMTTLLVRQNADGGWGFDQGFDSNPIVTAEVLVALTSIKTQTPPAAVIAAAQAYLANRKNADGSYGGGVLETATTFRALALSGYALSATSNATLTYLISQQGANGAWGNDPYLTARVLEAYGTNKSNLTIKSGDFTLTPGSVADGATVKATIKVTNIGGLGSTATTAGLYVGDVNGRSLGSANVGALAAGASTTLTINFVATNLTGRQTIAAVIDPAGTLDEMRKDDNTSTLSLVVDGKPDLQVFGSDIVTSPARMQPGQAGTIAVTIRNNGEGDATNVGYAIYDGVNGTETLLKKDVLPSILTGTAQVVSIPATLTGGTHVIRAVADPDALIAETNETNNSASRSIAVTAVSNVDLRIRAGNVTAVPSRPSAGQPITITAIVENAGTDPVHSSIAFFDGAPGAGGVVISVLPITIDANTSQNVQANYVTTASSRVIYAVADPDNSLLEIDEGNNQAFTSLTDQYADLAIDRDGIVLPRGTLSAGQSVSARVVVKNKGLIDATGVQVQVYDDLPQNGGNKVADVTINVPAQGKVVVPATWTVRAGQRLATALVNPAKTIFEVDYTNNKSTRSYTANGNETDVRLWSTRSLDASGLVVGSDDLSVTGIISATIQVPSNKSFNVALFEDVDGDNAFNTDTDNLLGSTLVQPGLNPQAVQIVAQGSVHFAPGKLMLYLDSSNAVNETDETNNFVDLWQDCQTTVDNFAPGVKWANTARAVNLAPVGRVVDTNGDDVIDANDVPVVVQASGGAILLVRGDNGALLWSQNFGFSGRQIAPVIADVDGDGKPEILAHDYEHKLVALNADGTRKWTSANLDRDPAWDNYIQYVDYSYAGAPVVADLDGDGKPEVISGRTVLNGKDGTTKWVGTGGSGRNWDMTSDHLYWEFFPDQEAPIATDVNGDGKLDVVAGNTAYKYDGTILWQRSDLPDGYTAPVYFSGQNTPKIVLVGAGKIYLLNSDGTTNWGPIAIPGGAMLGGAPTVFMDGSTGPWVGVAGDGYYSVLNAQTGAVRWTKQTTTDFSFGITATNAATAFDFGSGMTLVYAARGQLILMRASDGLFRYTLPITQGTYYPMSPVVADVNDDGHADILVPGTGGLQLISDPTWNAAPAIYNEFAYHVVNVSNEMGAIPKTETQTSYSRVHYRTNNPVAVSGAPLANLTASYLRADTNGYPQRVTLVARVGNNGWTGAPATKLAFYRLETNGSSTLMGTTDVPALNAGEYGDVGYTINNPVAGSYTFYAVADSANALSECNETDNRTANVPVRFSADISVDQALLFVDDPGPRPGDTIMFTAIANLSGAIDSSAITAQFYLGPPSAGGTPISGALPVEVLSTRGKRTARIIFPWQVVASTGPQTVYVVYDPNNTISEDSETNNTGTYALDVSVPEEVKKLSGSVTLTPPSAEPGTPVGINVLLQNIGNVPLSNIALEYNVTGGVGTGFTGQVTLDALPKYKFASIDLGSFTPGANGTYTVVVTAVDPSVTVVAGAKSITVAPFAGAQMTAVPTRVPTTLPLVQCHTAITRNNTIVVPDDPIVPLIKAHIQSGLNWQAPVLNNAMNDNCFKCHVQAQGIVGFEGSLLVSGITVNTTVEQRMYDQTVQSQNSDGHFGTSGYPKTTTIVGAWALSYWHDIETAKPYILNALEGTLRYQNADGSFDCDHCDISYGNREAMTMMAMIELAKGYELTKDQRYLTALTKSVQWAMAYDYASARTRGPEYAARVSIGLSSALPQIVDTALANSMTARINTITAFLKSLQNPDGSFGTLTTPDYPIIRTAQCLYALALAGTKGTDPGLRAAILWLINKQQTNGGWKEFANETNQVQWIDETTWAMIALPAAFARLGQFDVDLEIVLPTSTDYVSANIPPSASRAVSGGKALTWRFPGVTESGYDLLLNVKLNGIGNEEQRPATGLATISYKDPYDGTPHSRNVTVPLITGFAPLTLKIATDKAVYPPQSPVAISATITNVGTTTDGITHDLVVRDGNGTTVATVATNDIINNLPARPFPGWHYDAPLTATITRDGTNRRLAFTVDFAQKLAAIGATGTFDRDSIRVSADNAPNQELYFSWLPSDDSGVRGTLTVQIPDDIPSGANFAAHVYFDVDASGFKPVSLYDQRVTTNTGGLVAKYWYLDTSRTNPNASSPSLVYTTTDPILTMAQTNTFIASPAPPRSEYWGSEWTGAIYIPSSATYQFLIGSDDGSWLYLDDQLVLQVPGLHGTQEVSTSRALTAGFHTFKYVVFNWCCGYSGYVKWAPPGKAFGYISGDSLYPSLPSTNNATVGDAVALPDGTVTKTYNWNTGTTAAGPYTANGTLKQFNTFIASDAAPFAISPAAELTGTIATDKPAYDGGETVHVTGTVRFASGNTVLSNLTATLTVISPASAVLATGTTNIASIVAGQSIPVRLDWPIGTSPAGTYTARLVVVDANNTQLVDTNVPFAVRPASETGRGITGTISTPAAVNQGESLPISVGVTNGGNAPLTAAPFEVTLVDPDTNAVVATLPFTADIAVGATYSTVLNHSTTGMAVKSYQAWLVSKITGTAVPLANTVFEVKAPPLKLELSIGGPARVLIWSDCANGNSAAGCPAVKPAFLTQTLTDAHIPWTLVGHQTDMLRELRTGAYDLVILYAKKSYEAKASEELIETVHAGVGMLYINNTPDADPKLLPALGVAFNGKLTATSTTLDLLASPFTTAGALVVNGDGMKLDLQTALAAAKVAATQAPAIAYNTFGLGRVVTLPFDDELTPSTDMGKFLLGAVKYVARQHAFVARSVVPIDFKITPPPGTSANLTVAAILPAGMTVVYAQPALSALSTGTSWNVTTDGSELHLYLWVRLPETAGSYTITGTVAFAGQLPAVQKTLAVEVTAAKSDLESALSADLTALAAAVPSGDRKAVSDTSAELSALAQTTDPAAGLEHVLAILRSLQSISIDTTAARADADRLLLYWQSRIGA